MVIRVSFIEDGVITKESVLYIKSVHLLFIKIAIVVAVFSLRQERE